MTRRRSSPAACVGSALALDPTYALRANEPALGNRSEWHRRANRERAPTLLALYDAAVAAAHPDVCLPPHLPRPPEHGRLYRCRGRQGGRCHGGRRRGALPQASAPSTASRGFTTAPHGTREALTGERPQRHRDRLGAASDAGRRERARGRAHAGAGGEARRRAISCSCCCRAARRRCGPRPPPASTLADQDGADARAAQVRRRHPRDEHRAPPRLAHQGRPAAQGHGGAAC